MDNKTVARILRETAELLEIDGAIIGRYRSYEKAAELIAGLQESVEQMAQDPAKLKELPGIGDRMVEHIHEILKTGDYSLRKKLLKKFPATLLEVIQLQSLGPKKVAFCGRHFRPERLRRGEAGERRQASGPAGIWGKDRAKHFEGGGGVQALDRQIPY